MLVILRGRHGIGERIEPQCDFGKLAGSEGGRYSNGRRKKKKRRDESPTAREARRVNGTGLKARHYN